MNDYVLLLTVSAIACCSLIWQKNGMLACKKITRQTECWKVKVPTNGQVMQSGWWNWCAGLVKWATWTAVKHPFMSWPLSWACCSGWTSGIVTAPTRIWNGTKTGAVLTFWTRCGKDWKGECNGVMRRSGNGNRVIDGRIRRKFSCLHCFIGQISYLCI